MTVDKPEAPALNVPDQDRSVLATYGFTFAPDAQAWQRQSGSWRTYFQYPLEGGLGINVLWYLPETGRYTFDYLLAKLMPLSASYTKAWQRNGEGASYDLERLTRDFDRILATYAPGIPAARAKMADALTYYLSLNVEQFMRPKPGHRPFADCMRVALHPAEDKSVLKPLWRERLPVDMLLLALDGIHPSLLTEFATPKPRRSR